MKDYEKQLLSRGVKVIAKADSYELAIKKNRVFTFERWYSRDLALRLNPYYLNHPQLVDFLDKGIYFQVKELIDIGYLTHNFDCSLFEIYNPAYHVNALIVTPEMYQSFEQEFNTKFKSKLLIQR